MSPISQWVKNRISTSSSINISTIDDIQESYTTMPLSKLSRDKDRDSVSVKSKKYNLWSRSKKAPKNDLTTLAPLIPSKADPIIFDNENRIQSRPENRIENKIENRNDNIRRPEHFRSQSSMSAHEPPRLYSKPTQRSLSTNGNLALRRKIRVSELIEKSSMDSFGIQSQLNNGDSPTLPMKIPLKPIDTTSTSTSTSTSKFKSKSMTISMPIPIVNSNSISNSISNSVSSLNPTPPSIPISTSTSTSVSTSTLNSMTNSTSTLSFNNNNDSISSSIEDMRLPHIATQLSNTLSQPPQQQHRQQQQPSYEPESPILLTNDQWNLPQTWSIYNNSIHQYSTQPLSPILSLIEGMKTPTIDTPMLLEEDVMNEENSIPPIPIRKDSIFKPRKTKPNLTIIKPDEYESNDEVRVKKEIEDTFHNENDMSIGDNDKPDLAKQQVDNQAEKSIDSNIHQFNQPNTMLPIPKTTNKITPESSPISNFPLSTKVQLSNDQIISQSTLSPQQYSPITPKTPKTPKSNRSESSPTYKSEMNLSNRNLSTYSFTNQNFVPSLPPNYTPSLPPNYTPSKRNKSTSPKPIQSVLEKFNEEDEKTFDRGRTIQRVSKEENVFNQDDIKEFEQDSLPVGLKPFDANKIYDLEEKEKLLKQALNQSKKFEILSIKSVKTLSKELKALDERCEYLRKTYKSLRQGRSKLQARLINYLKSESLVFSKDKLLKQEEALSDLNKAIDDWANKLDFVENRRLRVRQKLLEHIAATSMLSNHYYDNNHHLTPPLSRETSPVSPVMKDMIIDNGKDNERERESIKIYADDQIMNLFNELELVLDNFC